MTDDLTPATATMAMRSPKKPKVVITGGSGFIGLHAVKQFKDLGWDIVVIDNDSGYGVSTEGYQLIVADIADFGAIEPWFEGADLVWHLAAKASIPEAILSPRQTMEVNVLGTCNVLQAAKRHFVKRVVVASTAALSGDADPTANPYALSKSTVEDLCQMYVNLYNLDVVVARFFNVWGEGQHDCGAYAPVMAQFTRAMKNNETIMIFGDGEQTRDFINVKDVINAMLTLSLPNEKVSGKIFEVGTGQSCSINELLEIMDPKKTKGIYLNMPARLGEVRHSKADCSALMGLGWKPMVNLKEYFNE